MHQTSNEFWGSDVIHFIIRGKKTSRELVHTSILQIRQHFEDFLPGHTGFDPHLFRLVR